jgi:hypothetical protein
MTKINHNYQRELDKKVEQRLISTYPVPANCYKTAKMIGNNQSIISTAKSMIPRKLQKAIPVQNRSPSNQRCHNECVEIRS